MRAQPSSQKRVWTSSEWDLTRRRVTHSQYRVRTAAAVRPYLQEAAVEEVQSLLLQEKLGRRWEQIPEEV